MNYCSDCGTEAMTSGLWPYTCDGCGVVHYCPPKPVVAILIPGSAPNSWVLIKRGREPFANGWAFPGGYLDHKEQWREAAVRETQEEIGLRLDNTGQELVVPSHNRVWQGLPGWLAKYPAR